MGSHQMTPSISTLTISVFSTSLPRQARAGNLSRRTEVQIQKLGRGKNRSSRLERIESYVMPVINMMTQCKTRVVKTKQNLPPLLL